jgi:dTDP-glucose 4,6-dehydratase
MPPLKNILVTGGAGFIGQNFVHHLTSQDDTPRITVLDALTYAANPSGLELLISSGQVEFVKGDITDLGSMEKLFAARQFDAVAHFAAESHVDRSILGPDAFVETNIIGTYNLLKCALADWTARQLLDRGRFLHVSTDEVFGDLTPDEAPFTENSPYRPSSPYSASKAGADHLVRSFIRTYRLPGFITNCSNNYGPYQHPEKLIPLMIIHALQGKPMPVYGDGLNVRDWLFVKDHCHALLEVLRRGEIGQTYNVGGCAERANKDVVRGICDLIDERMASDAGMRAKFPSSPPANGKSCTSLITSVADRPGHDRRYAINGDFLKQSLGVGPRENFHSGLRRTVNWYMDNEAWWQRALSTDFSQWMQRNYGSRETSGKS